MDKINIAIPNDPEIQKRFERHLSNKALKWELKGGKEKYYEVEIDDPMQAFWLGCNFVSITHKLFDGPLTISG